MNAIDLLERQHEETMQLLNLLEKAPSGQDRKTEFKKLQTSLLAHMTIEEELFYQTVALAQPEGEPIAEGYEEHAAARTAMERCARAINEEELFRIRITVLKEMVRHHVAEERAQILPRAQKAIPSEQLEALGIEMEARFSKALTTNPAPSLNRMATSRAKAALHP